MSSKRTFKIAMPEGLDTHDTSPPPLPSWLKGFLVTSKAPSDVRRAGLEVTNILGEFFFKLAYDDVDVPASMVKPGSTEVPYDTAEAIRKQWAIELANSRDSFKVEVMAHA